MEMENGMEIERKWLVSDWPEKAGVNLNLVKEEKMRQGYVSVEPTVRIREEISARNPEEASYLLTFKSSGLLSRKEIEFPIEKRYFAELEELISHPLVPKVRRTYALPEGGRGGGNRFLVCGSGVPFGRGGTVVEGKFRETCKISFE